MKQKKIKQKIRVEDDVYLSGVYILLNYAPDKVKEEVNKIMGGSSAELNDMANFTGRHFVVENKGKIERFVWIKDFSWNCIDIAALIHEILHLVIRILDDRGVPLKEQNSEAIAYLMEFYTREILLKIKK